MSNTRHSSLDKDASPGLLARACAHRGGAAPPVWLMRQAGRFLPEYRELRRKHSFVEMCTQPEIAYDVSLMPYRRFGMDGVVVFYDILFLAEAMGAPLEFTERGPAFLKPLRSETDLQGLHEPDLQALEPKKGTGAIIETIRRLRQTLPPRTAVIGFAGAPFTVAAYLTEGSFHRSGESIRRLLHERPNFLHDLLKRLTSATAEYLCAQVDAGADVVQLFDTWAGILPTETYREFALPYQKEIFQAVQAAGCPSILYVNGCSHLLESMAVSGASVLSIDWRQPLPAARKRLGVEIGLQGNLDPSALFQPEDGVRRSCRSILDGMRGDPGYIFNLGHGVLPETPIASVEALVEETRREVP